MKESGVSSPANSDWAGASEIFLNVDSCLSGCVVCVRAWVRVYIYVFVGLSVYLCVC